MHVHNRFLTQAKTLLQGLACCCILSAPAAAQITAAPDGTGTIVNLNGSEFSIEGGTLSGDSANLFHSFQQFGLDAGQIADFLVTQPNLENILGRVTGGDPSLINGLLQVSGSDSNLYLMNPAGIVFGVDAALNVPGDFTATTATGIQFGDQWFNGTGPNGYSALNGSPTGFQLGGAGAIINSGDLSVGSGNRLLLLGSTVANVGDLMAPEGQILIVAHPGENVLQLRFPGYTLGLELAVDENPVTHPTAWTLPIATLPELLKLDGVSSISPGLTMTADDTLQLASSDTDFPIEPGTAIIGGSLDVSSQQQAGGDIGIVADRIGVSGTLNANGLTAGGNILVGGDYRGQGDLPTASRTVVTTEAAISADAANGDGGQVIIWADETTGFFGDISARGGLTLGDGGFVEVSGREHLAFDGTVDLSSTYGELGTLLLDPINIIISDQVADTPGVVATFPDFLEAEFPNQTTTISH